MSFDFSKVIDKVEEELKKSVYKNASAPAVIPSLGYEENRNLREEQLEMWKTLQTQSWKLEKESHFTVNEAHYIEGYIFTGENEEYDIFFKALVAKDFNEIVIIENDFEDLLWRVSGTEFTREKKNADKLLMETIKKNRVRIITGVK